MLSFEEYAKQSFPPNYVLMLTKNVFMNSVHNYKKYTEKGTYSEFSVSAHQILNNLLTSLDANS